MIDTSSAQAIRHKYPQLAAGKDWYFQDDGNGPYLAMWPEDLALPTAPELLSAAKDIQLATINLAYEAEFVAIKQQYPDAERESWPIQLSEAAALAEDAQAPAPFLDALLLARGFGETRAELAAKVQAKNQAYSVVSASLTGKRHNLERQVQNAETLEQVAGISW
ncbi:hypothetical protein E8E95_05825 [Pseudomonas sp. BN414]|uniref:XkdW family protein n=1 Tax=Pseudomonas sp. BN414 TaxID=2567888 RepID=UPI0024555422|nr:XkdW family protein [Pseudomonas sp. BN414]MDH4566192.1 hypothetical protein [Pseudomonas sp. BN414]